MVGVYLAPDPGAKDDQRKQGIYPFPLADIFDKAISVGTGQCPVSAPRRRSLRPREGRGHSFADR